MTDQDCCSGRQHIAELGTHQQLLKHNGLYKRLVTVQQHLLLQTEEKNPLPIVELTDV